MALLKDVEVHYVKCDPARPSPKFDKANPRWEIQCRTTNPEQKDAWVELGLKPRLLVGKPGTDNEGVAILTEEGKRQWRLNLSKKSITRDGKEATPVEVINGARTPIDPNTIGNGSICNIRVWQYEYTAADGTKKFASVLMGIQVKRHLVYNRPVRDDEFEDEDTETIMPEGDDSDFSEPDPQPTPQQASAAPAAPKPAVANPRPATAF